MTLRHPPLSVMHNARSTVLHATGPAVLPALGNDEIQIWIVEVGAPDVDNARHAEILAPAERTRAARFRSESDRDCFIQRRAALRMILAGYLGVAPRDVAFTANEFGKPSVVAPPASAGLSFNASHSGTVAAIAVARAGRIGIDVERLRPMADAASIAARFFAAAEAAALAALEPHDRVEGFFNAWTRKEAVVKAVGRGLLIPLDAFEVSLRPREPPAILRWDIPDAAPRQWRIHHIEPAAGYVGALVVDRAANVSLCRRWPG
jgi:4'-phosphopantetheinyl transferase